MARRQTSILDRRAGATEAIGPAFDVLLSAAAAGAPWAFERVFRTLSPAVFGYLKLQGSREPEDLTSEVFMGAFRGIAGFSGDEDAFRSWVFTIAHRRLVDERRRWGRRPVVVDREVTDDDLRGPTGDVEDEALASLGELRVRELCRRLAPDYRDVLLLRLVAGLTFEQVGAALDRSTASVKALQRRALLCIRQEIEWQGATL